MQACDVARCVAAYAARLQAAIGERHQVASPLGAWLLLALAGPASSGADRVTLAEIIGCDVDRAASAAAELLARPHPLVASAARARSLRIPIPEILMSRVGRESGARQQHERHRECKALSRRHA